MPLFHKHKNIFLLIGMAVCVVAIFITYNPNYRPNLIVQSLSRLVAPLQSAATSAANWVGFQVSLFWEMSYLQQENSLLREQIGWLEIENQRLQLAGDENNRLLELLDIRERYGELPFIGARIISHAPSNWDYDFFIDRGTDDGLVRNMAVLGPGGMVGIIQQVYPTQSRVTSIVDNRFAVAAESTRTEDQGIVVGDSSMMQDGLVRMERISATAQIMAGDEVITSVLSMFPPGIRIGVVTDVQPTPDGLAQYAIISPWADVRELRHVQVVTQLPREQNEDELME